MAPRKKKEPIKNDMDEAIQNGLAGGIGFAGLNTFGFPGNQSWPGSEPLSNTNTLFKNLRWYLISNFRQVLSQLYVELGLVQTICDVPVDDALRGGIEIKSHQLDEDQIEELQISLDRDDDINTVGQACKWNRLYGGAGILILTDQDPEDPLNLEAIGPNTPLEFRAVDMWELFWDKQNTEGYDPTIQTQDFEFYNYYAEQVHKSRVMRMKGLTAPSFIRPRLRGWGFSVVEQLVRSLNQYLKATDLGFQVLDEFKLDVYKIKNLVNTLLSPNGQQKVQQRVQMANWQKNYQNAIVMDAEDDFGQKQLSFAGLAETMVGIRMQVASDMRMPLTKLFGISAQGFSSGVEDLEVYNAMVESQVRNKVKYDLLRVCEIKCQKLFGFIPDDMSISFKPLRVLSAEQEENVKTQKFTRAFQSLQAGAITIEEFRDNCNKGDIFDITLDNVDLMNPPQDDKTKEGAQDPAQPKDVTDPGANREDTRKPKAWEYGGMPKEPKNPAEKEKAPSDTTAKESKPAKPVMPKRENEIKQWTANEDMERLINGSPAFDKASYLADGGDGQIDSRKEEFYTDPRNVNKGLWEQAKAHSVASMGTYNWKFAVWYYQKSGGKFSMIQNKQRPLGEAAQPDMNTDPAQWEKVMNPGKVDEGLWEKAKKKTMEEYGELKYAVVTTIYKEMGGKFG